MLTNKKIEQAIKYYENLKNYAKQWESEYPDQPQALDKADVALESLDALRWRDPVKEPPEEDAYILVYLTSRCAIIAHYDKNSGEWSDDTGSSICNHVKAWLPLPEWREEE